MVADGWDQSEEDQPVASLRHTLASRWADQKLDEVVTREVHAREIHLLPGKVTLEHAERLDYISRRLDHVERRLDLVDGKLGG